MNEGAATRLHEKLLELYGSLDADEKELFITLMAESTAEVEGHGMQAYGGFGNFMTMPGFGESNFAIQQAMSDYNQQATMASSLQKKADDTISSQYGKI